MIRDNRRTSTDIQIGSIALAALLLLDVAAQANTITIDDVALYRDQRTPNSINQPVGDRIVYRIDVLPNGDLNGDGFADSDGISPPSTVTATNGSVTRVLGISGSDTSPNQFSGSIAYSTSLTDPWTFTIQNGSDTLVTTTPSIVGVAAMPFVENMSLSGSGTSPTFHWTVPTIPAGLNVDSVNISLYDLSDIVGTSGINHQGLANRVFTQRLSSGITSFTVPAGELDPEKTYAVAIRLVDRRTSPAPGTAAVQSQSSSFFDFSTSTSTPGNAPVYLPVVNPTGSPAGTPIYSFKIDVTGGTPVFIDPLVATGYVYETGAGDPNFASVLLPDVGDGQFELWLFDPSDVAFDTHIVLTAGVLFDFTTQLGAFGIGVEGIDKFQILGIETSAGLNPYDATAFVTGLTFVGDGRFTGTMTPVTTEVAAVPEPGTLLLLLPGFLGLGALRRRRTIQAALKN